MMKSYEELITYKTFQERLAYLSSVKFVGEISFGHQRYLNQDFYRSSLWRKLRKDVILRDQACDLGVQGYDILDQILIHHINPLRQFDIENMTDFLINPNYLITTSRRTHQVIHYGGSYQEPVMRHPNDHIPWR